MKKEEVAKQLASQNNEISRIIGKVDSNKPVDVIETLNKKGASFTFDFEGNLMLVKKAQVKPKCTLG